MTVVVSLQAMLLVLNAGTPPSGEVTLDCLLRAPRLRREALLTCAVTQRDSTPDIAAKAERYLTSLREIADRLRFCYFAGLDLRAPSPMDARQRAEYLASLHYPLAKTRGASGFGALVLGYEITGVESEIRLMACEILRQMKDTDVKVSGNSLVPDFAAWEADWSEAEKALVAGQMPFARPRQ